MDSYIFHIKKIVLLTWGLNVRCPYNHVEMMMLIQGSHSTWKTLKNYNTLGKPGQSLEFCDFNTSWQNGIKPRKNGHSDVWHFALGVTLICKKWLERKPLPWYSTEKFSICSNEILSLQILVWKNMEVTLEIMKKIHWKNSGEIVEC